MSVETTISLTAENAVKFNTLPTISEQRDLLDGSPQPPHQGISRSNSQDSTEITDILILDSPTEDEAPLVVAGGSSSPIERETSASSVEFPALATVSRGGPPSSQHSRSPLLSSLISIPVSRPLPVPAVSRLQGVESDQSELLTNLPKSEDETVKKHRFSVIGDYVLYDLVPGSVDATLHATKRGNPEQLRICKVVPMQSFTNAVRATLRLDCSPHVCQVLEMYRGPDYVYLFFETPSEDLHAFMRKKRRLRECEARPLYNQIVQAVAECHERGVIIRDVKLRKFVFTDENRSVLKLESLEGAHVQDDQEDDTVGERVGCLAYVSPEVLIHKRYSGRKADVWSLGVVLYAMLVGRYPFYEDNQAGMLARIHCGLVFLPESLSPGARSLLKTLLHHEPEQRLEADDILHHPWFSRLAPADDGFRVVSSKRDQMVPQCPQKETLTWT